MARAYDIPKDYNTAEPLMLREQLRRLSTALFNFVADAESTYQPRWRISPIYARGDVNAEYEQMVRIKPQKADDVVDIFLPRPNSVDAGRQILLRRDEDPAFGTVTIRTTGGSKMHETDGVSLINGSTCLIVFDGENWVCSLADSY